MACPVCGNASACLHERARTAVLIDPDFSEDSEQRFARSLEERSLDERSLEQPASLAVAANGGPQPQTALDDEYWRQEVASRVEQHRARRRGRVDPNATMQLDFAGDGVYAVPEIQHQPVAIRPPMRESTTSIKERVMAMVMASAAFREAAREPELRRSPEVRSAGMQLAESEPGLQLEAEAHRLLSVRVDPFGVIQ